MVISRALTEENSKAAERRVNSTLAHESGHGLLHVHLFALAKPSKSLFDQGFDIKEQKILCRKEAVDGASDHVRSNSGNRWWEIQANMAIGGLLLPRALTLTALGSYLVEQGRLRARILDYTRKESAARHLAEVFDVNPIVARIRLEGLFPSGQENQLTL
jgi:Zn-dependent peptidase ImmA (M78 family)